MSDLKQKLTRRRPRPVTIDGDEFFVFSMTLAEADHVDALSAEPKPGEPSRAAAILGYCLARCLVDASGARLLSGEDDPAIQEIPIDVAKKLAQAIREATNPPEVEMAKKN